MVQLRIVLWLTPKRINGEYCNGTVGAWRVCQVTTNKKTANHESFEFCLKFSNTFARGRHATI